MDKIAKMKELIEKLNVYRNEYYNNSKSLISDFEYDQLFDELAKLEKETNIYMSNSPTQTVGYEVKSELKKVKHSHPMLSLGKTKSTKDLINFSNGRDCIISLKMDGLTILNSYDNGVLYQSETRGNGEVGEIVTHNTKVFDNLPLTIPGDSHFEIEGEAIITYYDFERINAAIKNEDDKYKNPRNLASGSVRQLDSSIAKDRHLKFVVWKLPKGFDTFIDGFEFAKKLGFEVVPYVKYNSLIDNIEEKIEELKNIAKEKSYPIDGLVITYNDVKYGESLGMTGHHPKHSLAFKFFDEEVEATLKDIEWTMGKTGSLCPTAIFEPVEIEGTTVERASLHNVSIMKSFELSYGDTITVYKANAIIPQVSDNVSKNKDKMFEIPSVCPICDGKTEIVKENDTEVLICTNSECKGKLLGKLCHFVSKNAINIDGLSEATLAFLIEKGWVKSFEDIYRLHLYEKEWFKCEGFGKKSVLNLLENIKKSKNTTLSRFIYAQSIPLIGRTASKDIEKYCNYSIDRFCEIMTKEDKKQFLSIEGFGQAMLDSLENWSNTHWIEFLELKKEFTFEENTETNHDNNRIDLSGKIFVVTGSLNHFDNRDQLKEKLEALGAKVSGSVSSRTTVLINNDINSISGKNKKAHELNIPIWSEEKLINEYNLLK